MKTLFKATLVAGALALSSLAASSPAAAQSFGFSFGTGGYGGYYSDYNYGRPYYGGYNYNRNCRLVTRVRYDRWGRPHRVRSQICRPMPRGYGYGYGYGRGAGYGYGPGYGYGW
jgi:hypothetical protein